MTTNHPHQSPLAVLDPVHDPDPAAAPPTRPTSKRGTARAPRRSARPEAMRLARTAGALYLIIFVCGLFAEAVVRSGLIVDGDAALTVANITESSGLFRAGIVADLVMVVADVAIAVVVYRLLAPVSRTVSALAAGFRIVQSAVLGLNLLNLVMVTQLLADDGLLGGFSTAQRDSLVMQLLTAHEYGYFLALAFFAVHLALLAWLIARSGFLPRFLSPLAGAAGVAYLVDTVMHLTISGYDGALSPVVLVPAVLGEAALLLWLLVKGVDAEVWASEAAGRNPAGLAADHVENEAEEAQTR